MDILPDPRISQLPQFYCVSHIWHDGIEVFTEFCEAINFATPSPLTYKTPQLHHKKLKLSRIKTFEGFIPTRSIEQQTRITKTIIRRRLVYSTSKTGLGTRFEQQHARGGVKFRGFTRLKQYFRTGYIEETKRAFYIMHATQLSIKHVSPNKLSHP